VINVDGYLRRLGVPDPGAPSAAALKTLLAAHVERVAYEVLDIHLGRVVPIDAAHSAERVLRGRGGYCYTLNGAFSVLLRDLGYQVEWHRSGVQHVGEDAPPGPVRANHLALVVRGLPSDDNPSGDWLADVGLGDGLHEPLPLHPGTYTQGPFTYRLRPSEVTPGGWRFDHDPAGSFAGLDWETRIASVADFQARHEYLSTSPESGFVRTCVTQRRDATGVDSLRGCVLHRVGSDAEPRVLGTPAEWFGALDDIFALPLTDLAPAERDQLWRRVIASHEDWLTAQSR
jgi:N-hydroxyarylamine O-acetyltransferase